MKIQSNAFRLTEPGQFEQATLIHDYDDRDIIVKPTKASVCHADLRYYTGNRRPEALAVSVSGDRWLPCHILSDTQGANANRSLTRVRLSPPLLPSP